MHPLTPEVQALLSFEELTVLTRLVEEGAEYDPSMTPEEIQRSVQNRIAFEQDRANPTAKPMAEDKTDFPIGLIGEELIEDVE